MLNNDTLNCCNCLVLGLKQFVDGGCHNKHFRFCYKDLIKLSIQIFYKFDFNSEMKTIVIKTSSNTI